MPSGKRCVQKAFQPVASSREPLGSRRRDSSSELWTLRERPSRNLLISARLMVPIFVFVFAWPGCGVQYHEPGLLGSLCCQRSPCICQTRVLEGLKATVCVCMGIAGRPPPLAGVASCPKAAPGGALLLPSLPLRRCRCLATSWLGLLGLASILFPSKRNYQFVFNVALGARWLGSHPSCVELPPGSIPRGV